MLTFETLLTKVQSLRYFQAEGELPPAIPLHYRAGKVPVVAVVGPNASGKSFLRRIVAGLCRKSEIECMGISMEMRVGHGPSAGNPMRAFVFGDEETQSTGENSAHSVTTGIKTCQGRSTPHVIFWDEPDLGLSDGYAGGVGQSIAAFARDMPKHTLAAFVVTHSKPLLRQLAPVEPHYLHVGVEHPPETLDAWLATEAPVLPMESLKDASFARFKRIQAILSDIQKSKGPR